MAFKAATGEAPPERRTIHFIFADPILVAMECVPVSGSSDLKLRAFSEDSKVG